MGWHSLVSYYLRKKLWAVEPGNRARLACYAGDGCDVECVIASVVWLCGGVMASEGASVASLFFS